MNPHEKTRIYGIIWFAAIVVGNLILVQMHRGDAIQIASIVLGVFVLGWQYHGVLSKHNQVQEVKTVPTKDDEEYWRSLLEKPDPFGRRPPT